MRRAMCRVDSLRSPGEQIELLRLGRRRKADAAAVADPVLARQTPDGLADRRRLGLGEVGTAAVEPLVLGQELRPVAGEAVEEMLAGAGLEVEGVRPDAAGAGLARRTHDLCEELRPVRDAGEDRGEADRGAYAGVDEPRERAQPLPRRRGARLRSLPDLVV